MNFVIAVMRGSRVIMLYIESATCCVSARPVPLGRYISTANWLRSLTGIMRVFTCEPKMAVESITRSPMPSVAQPWRNMSESRRS